MIRVHPLALAVGLCCVVPAAAQERAVLSAIVEARRLAELKQDEDAVLVLRDAQGRVARIEDAGVRRRLQKSVDDLIGDLDPLDKATSKAREDAARALLKPAQAYTRRKWNRAALPLLEIIAALSEKVGGRPLERAQAALGLAADGPRDGIQGWFGKGVGFAGAGYWKVEEGIAESPKLQGGLSVGLRSERRTEGDCRIQIEVLASDNPSKASICFAMEPSKNGDDYYILELRHERGFSDLRLLHYGRDGRLDEMANIPLAMTRAERAAWTELTVDLAGDRITVDVGGLERADARSVTPDLEGCIGLFVSGDSPFRDPIRFRNLRVTPL
ncbi:MAG: hypothetical protein ACO4CT_10645 [Planctomycetota bacterium]|jgi:hypothetical protein